MIRDIVRTVCVLVAMTSCASLVIEVRYRLAVIDLAARAASPQHTFVAAYQPVEPPQTGRLAGLGRATLQWADAALGVVR